MKGGNREGVEEDSEDSDSEREEGEGAGRGEKEEADEMTQTRFASRGEKRDRSAAQRSMLADLPCARQGCACSAVQCSAGWG